MGNSSHLVGEMIVVLIAQAMFIYAAALAWRIRGAIPLGRFVFALTVLIALWVGTSRRAVVDGGGVRLSGSTPERVAVLIPHGAAPAALRDAGAGG